MFEKYNFMQAKMLYLRHNYRSEEMFSRYVQLLFFSNATTLQDDTAFRFAIPANNLSVF